MINQAPGGRGSDTSEFRLTIVIIVFETVLAVLEVVVANFHAVVPASVIAVLGIIYNATRFLLKMKGVDFEKVEREWQRHQATRSTAGEIDYDNLR